MELASNYESDDAMGTSNGGGKRKTASIPGLDDDKKLFVGGLSRDTEGKDLQSYFSKFGSVESVSLKTDKLTGMSRGFAFIAFTSPQAVSKCLTYGEHYINGKKVDTKTVTKRSPKGKIFVGGLTPEITEEDIKAYFSSYGNVLEIQSPYDRVRNQRKNYCFVVFDSTEVVSELLKNPKQYICNKEVDVKKVITNPEHKSNVLPTGIAGSDDVAIRMMLPPALAPYYAPYYSNDNMQTYGSYMPWTSLPSGYGNDSTAPATVDEDNQDEKSEDDAFASHPYAQLEPYAVLGHTRRQPF